MVVDRLAGDQALDDPHRLGHLGKGPGLAPDVAQRRVAAPDAADRARAVGVVQRRERRGEHRPVPGSRVRDHRTDDDPLGLGQDSGENDERLLPQNRRVEHPDVGEAVLLGPLGQIHHAPGRGIGLEHHAEVHPPPPSSMPAPARERLAARAHPPGKAASVAGESASLHCGNRVSIPRQSRLRPSRRNLAGVRLPGPPCRAEGGASGQSTGRVTSRAPPPIRVTPSRAPIFLPRGSGQ